MAVEVTESIDSQYEGKTVSILGDSISSFAGVCNDASVNSTIANNRPYYPDSRVELTQGETWWQKTIDALGMRLLVNNSSSGSCVLEDSDNATAAYKDRAVQLHNSKTGETPDYIFVFLGTNDFSYYNKTLGSADAVNYDELITDNQDGSYSYATPNTTCEAYVIMLHKMTLRYPDAEIFCMTLLPRRNPDYDGAYDFGAPTSFNNDIKKIANRFGCTVVDFENCGISDEPSNFDYYIFDKAIHPNPAGMQKMSEAVVSAVIGENSSIYRVIGNYVNATSDNDAIIALSGESYKANIAVNEGYMNLSVQVTMGGNDITSSVYRNGTISIPNVTGPIEITANATPMPYEYRWELSGNTFVSVGEGLNANSLKRVAGSISNGIMSNFHYQMEKSITVRHNWPWAIEFKASGSDWSGMILSNTKAAATKGNNFIYKGANDPCVLAFGKAETGRYDNYGVSLTDIGIDSSAEHVYRLENRIYDDGTNMVYLIVDGVEYGAMNNYFNGNTNGNEFNDWISGKDITFNYIGATNLRLNKCKLEYLQITECTHEYKNGTCIGCGMIDANEEHIHSFGEWEITRPETCTEDGEQVRYCECGEMEFESIPAAHALNSYDAASATCTEYGHNAYEACSRCDYTTKTVIEPTGHTYDKNNKKVCAACGGAYGPVIIAQPKDINASANEKISFTFEAKGVGLTYTWYYKDPSYTRFYKSTLTTANYTINALPERLGRQVYCVVTDKYGNSVTTDIATLNIIPDEELSIGSDITTLNAVLGEKITIDLNIKGDGLTYVWYYKDVNHNRFYTSTLTSATYSVNATAERNGRQVYCVVTDQYGNQLTSQIVTLVIASKAELSIDQDLTVVEGTLGNYITVDLNAKGDSLTYEWYYREAGSKYWYKSTITDAIYKLRLTQERMNREVYCVVTDAFGNKVTSNIITLKAVCATPLEIVSQPSYTPVAMGEKAVVTMEVQGDGLTYVWYYRSAGTQTWYKSTITDDTYSFTLTDTRVNREVYCVITDAFGNTVTTNTVVLTEAEVPAYTQGLIFELKNNSYYIVVGLEETCTDTKIVIPAMYNDLPVKNIGASAFENNTAITSVSIPETVTVIDQKAFAGCTSLTSMTLPKDLKTLRANVFSNCTSLATIQIFDNLTLLSANTFQNTAYYNNPANWENGILYLGNYVIGTDDTVIKCEIKEGTKFFAANSFNAAVNMTEISLPKSVNIISFPPFASSTKLERITVDADNPYITAIDGNLYDKAGTELIFYAVGKTETSFVIPSGVTSIAPAAFTMAKNLEEIIIPASVTTIENAAFQYCTNLKSIHIPDGVKTIASYLFSYCISLEEVRLPDSIQSIGSYAFQNCGSLKTIDLPDGLGSIGVYAFTNCKSLTEIDLPDGVKSIGNYAFSSCTSLQTINFSEDLVSIGDYAFAYCKSLIELDIPNSVKTIGQYAFRNCTSLKTVNLSSGIQTLSYCLFRNCTSLESVIIPDSITMIDVGAFYVCNALESVFYTGTQDKWNLIAMGTNNNGIKIATIYYYSETEPSEEGNYWYYLEDGNIAIWGDSAEEPYTQGLIFTLSEDKTYYIVSDLDESCTETEIVIPATYKRKPVKEIGSYAFHRRENFTNVAIPDSVTSIGDFAFYTCASLIAVDMPNGLITIGEQAFANCRSLTEIDIPDGVESMGSYAFAGCSLLKGVTIPEGVTTINYGVFLYCNSLQYVVLPKSLTTCSGSAFSQTALFKVYYWGTPDEWNAITIAAYSGLENAIVYCYSETEPTKSGNWWHYDENGEFAIWKIEGYTNGLIFTLAGKETYYIVSGLEADCEETNIVIPATYYDLPVKFIGASAFENHTAITSVSIPETVISICQNAFAGCTSLTSITLPESLQYLEPDAFKDCTSLAVIHLSENIESLSSSAFQNTAYYNNPANWENGVLYLENYLLAADETVTICEVKEGTTLIGADAFRNAVNMTKISLPESLIEQSFAPLFGGCSSLVHIAVHEDNLFYTSIDGNLYNKTGTTLIQYAIGKTATTFTIPDNVTTIGWAFGDATFLEEVNIPESVTTIDDAAFQNCTNLKSIAIPSGVSVIKPFTFNDCSSLEEVVLPENLVTIGRNAFSQCTSLTTVDIPDGVTSIGEYAFQNCSGLTSIDIPDGVTSIENSTFYGCSGLTSINIPNDVENIGAYAFEYCISLHTINLPDSVESIGNYAFNNCTSLQTINLSKNLVSIGGNAFAYCISLTEIDIPDSVKSMGQYAFRNCTSLKTVDLPSGIQTLSSGLFRQCTSLESVTIPEGVSTINSSAFSQTALSEVYYLGTEDEWNAITISSSSGLKNVSVYFYSENKPIAGEYAWHYNEDGNIAIW